MAEVSFRDAAANEGIQSHRNVTKIANRILQAQSQEDKNFHIYSFAFSCNVQDRRYYFRKDGNI